MERREKIAQEQSRHDARRQQGAPASGKSNPTLSEHTSLILMQDLRGFVVALDKTIPA